MVMSNKRQLEGRLYKIIFASALSECSIFNPLTFFFLHLICCFSNVELFFRILFNKKK